MDKPITGMHYIASKANTTSDSKVGFSAGTAETDNLSGIIKNNIVLFESCLSTYNIEIADSTDTDPKAEND